MTACLLRFHHGSQSILLMGRLFVNWCRQVINHLGLIEGFLTFRKITINKNHQEKKRIVCVLFTIWNNDPKSRSLTQILGFPTATDWVVANEELTAANRYCIKNLKAGDLLRVRVVAVNPGGRSEPGTVADPVPIREVVGESLLHLTIRQLPVKLSFIDSFFLKAKISSRNITKYTTLTS